MPAIEVTISLLQRYGYFLLFPIAVAEGPIVTIIAAFLASQGFLNIIIVYLIVVLADLSGDLLYYAIGKWGKNSFRKWREYISVPEVRLNKLQKHYEFHGGKTLLFGKLTHSAGFAVLTAAGAVGMPLKEFLWYNLLGTLPKSLVFVLVGYFVGRAYSQLNVYINKITTIVFIVFIFVAIFYFFIHKKQE